MMGNNSASSFINEAQRCLLCKNARCSIACPAHTPIPQVMELYKKGELNEAGKILFKNNPFSALTSILCDHDRLCQGKCIRGIKSKPIAWHEIEHEISYNYLYSEHVVSDLNLSSNKSDMKSFDKNISIIGAGPAGLTAALILSKHNYKVKLYDAKAKTGGVLRYGIPNFRLKKDILDRYDELLQDVGVEFYGNCKIVKSINNDEDNKHSSLKNIEQKKIIKLSEIEEKSNAVLITAGAEKPTKINIPGENSDSIIYALNFLEEPSKYKLGENVLIIGGGNVAMDAARTALRQGANTFVYYRKSFENMPANKDEIEMAKKEGIEFQLFEAPVEIKDEHIAVMIKCRNVEKDGRIITEYIEGTEHEVHFDTMIIAAGERADQELIEGDCSEKLFQAGDFYYGPKTVIHAVESAKEVSKEIMSYLK